MSLQNLQSVLQNQVNAGGAITLSAATLTQADLVAGTDFDKILQSYLVLKDPLSVKVTGKIPAPDQQTLTVSGTASLLGVEAVSVTVLFTPNTTNKIDALITIQLPDNWNFKNSFPVLIGFPFNALSVSKAFYLLTTAAQITYVYEKNSLTLVQGLNFASLLGMDGAFGLLKKLIDTLTPDVKILFTGSIDTTKIQDLKVGQPALSLTGSITQSITANTHFNLSIPQVLLTNHFDENNRIMYWLYFSSTLSVNNKPFSIFQAAILQNSPNLTLSMLPVKTAITPSDIIQLIGGEDYTKSIPPVLEDIFESVGLTSLCAAINLNTMEVLALSGGIGTSKPWQMGQFTIEQLVLNCRLLMPFTTGRSVSVIFTATASIFPKVFKGVFNFEISYDVTSKELIISANFQGTASLNDLIGELSDHTVVIPKNFAAIEFDDFGITFTKQGNTYEYTLYGSAKGTFNISVLDSPLVATFEVNVDSASKTYLLVGGLTIGNSFFTATVRLSGGTQVLSGSWQALNEDYLGVKDLLQALNLQAPDIPANLDLGLKSAGITYDITNETLIITAASVNYGNAVFVAYKNATTSKWQFYMGFMIDKPINLSNLPLVNKVLPDKERIEIKKLQVLLASAPLNPANAADKKEMAIINQLIGTDYPAIPEQGLPGTVALSAQFDFGGFIIPLSIGTPGKTIANGSSTGTLPAKTTGTFIGAANGNNAGTVPPPTQAADGATWFTIQKNFGPVNFEKIGVKYEDGVLWFLLNAALSVAGLEISVAGLSVGSPLNTFEPRFNIEGLGIEYSNQAVTISGAFVKMPVKEPITLEFAGTATIQLKTFGIAAIGSYAQFDKQTSMFVFASINGPFGGPAFFFVTGFCGGFGYNSKLRLPGQNEVYQFPFVGALSDPSILGKNPSPTAVLQKIMGPPNPWVTPSVGDIWLSAGIKFSTFEVVNSTALLIAEFGNKFLLALIGLSTARFPMEGPEVYAYVELQLEALFDPGDGVISFTAVLSPNSYLLDRACHLTGGFAMIFWFGPHPHAGDFVVTLGGYSPYFNVPDYYPQEPRLGLNWAIDTTISITGGVYFALTPAAVMAGGSLNVTYKSGNLSAWFIAYADIIIWYNPFHFIADIGISIGASYKADLLFCSKTFTIELGASLTLWGPATGGTVTIHWFVISFTINFGADRSSSVDKQGWSDFVKVLPTPENVVKIVPLTGLVSGQPAATNSANVASSLTAPPPATATWMVRADNFRFTTNSAIPLSELYIDGNASPVKKGKALNIKPMEATQLTSRKTLSIVNKETGKNVLNESWNISFVSGNVPSALWGTGSNTALPSGDYLISDQLSGFEIQVPSPVLGGGTGNISIQEDLQFDPLTPGINPLRLGLSPQGPVPVASDQTILAIEQIMSTQVKGQRDLIFDTFSQFDLQGLINGDLNHIAAGAGELFSNEPLLIND